MRACQHQWRFGISGTLRRIRASLRQVFQLRRSNKENLMRSLLRRALKLLPGVLVMVLSIHFGMTLVYLMPLNPIVLRVAPVVDGYMVPWFVQDWHLFAPNPINETHMLLVSCRLQKANG